MDRRQVLIGGGALAAVATTATAKNAFDSDRALAALAASAKAEPFHGAVLVAAPGQAPRTAAFGLADIEAGLPVKPDTRFGIASISKFLTTAVILKLAQEGRLAIEAPITSVLKDYRRDAGDRVTIAHLLSNTSGIPNGFITAVKADATLTSLQLPTDEAVRRYGSGDLAFEPGAQFDYSMTNWILVRAIVETVAGAPFETVIADRMLKPLALKDTGAPIPPDIAPVAIPYRTVEPVLRNLQRSPAFAVASGGYFSNVSDLHHAARAVFNGRYLSKASLKTLTTVRVPEQSYALGGRVKALTLGGAERRFAWETGNSGGYKSLLAHDLSGGPTLVLLNNTNLSQKRVDEIAIAALTAAWPA